MSRRYRGAVPVPVVEDDARNARMVQRTVRAAAGRVGLADECGVGLTRAEPGTYDLPVPDPMPSPDASHPSLRTIRDAGHTLKG